MALTKSTTAQRLTVDRDFPELPELPKMTISQDNEKMEVYGESLERWYFEFRKALFRKLDILAAEIDKKANL